MTPPPDLAAMALFARVLQHGSFSEAARRAGVPLSTLSRRISALEAALGVRLLERTTRSLQPTDAGREFLPYCQQLLDAVQGGCAALEQRQLELTGTLRLAAPPSLSELLLVPLVDAFLGRWPKATVKVLVTDRHLDLVEDEIDVSLRVGRQADSSLIQHTLARYRHVLVAAPAYLERAGALAQPSDLRSQRLLVFGRWLDEPQWKLSKGQRTESLRPRPTLAMNDYAGIVRASVAGMGIAEVPSPLCARELERGELVRALPGWDFDEVELAAYSLPRRHRSRVLEAFLTHCAADVARVLGGLGGASARPGRAARPSRKPRGRS